MTDTMSDPGLWPIRPRGEILTLDHALGAGLRGMDFYVGAFDALLRRLLDEPGQGHMIAVCNTHMLVTAERDPALAAALRAASFSLCDGKPIAWLMGLLAGRRVERITGPDVFRVALGEHLAACRIALVGGDPDILDRLAAGVPEEARANLLLIDPGRVAEGDGPSAEILARLRAFRPRIVFVGLGCPKQEKWIAQAIAKVPAHFLGVGAAFDYGAGDLRRAPRFMQAAGAEWIFRAMQQPRLFRRYFSTLPRFLGIFGLGLLARARNRRADLVGEATRGVHNSSTIAPENGHERAAERRMS